MRTFSRKTVTLAASLLVLGLVAGGIWAGVSRRADADRDGIVETSDMFDFAEAYRNRETTDEADLNLDGRVDEMDIFIFLREWNADRDRALGEEE
jgi:hypothetical protein